MPKIDNIQVRRGTAAQWISADPTLAAGELGVETDTRRVKVGDGSTAWTSLDYIEAEPPGGKSVPQSWLAGSSSGSNWVALGALAADAGSNSGESFVAIGALAGTSGTTMSNYVCVGWAAGAVATTADGLTAIGFQAASRITTAKNSVWIGASDGTGYETVDNVVAISTGATIRYLFDGSNYFLPSLPTSDPGVAGALWDDGGALSVSQ